MTDQQPYPNQNTSDPTDHKQGGPADKRAEPARPVRSEGHSPESRAENGKPTANQKHFLDYLVAAFAFIAAIGGVAAAIFTGWQAWISNDQEVRQLRAYVHVTGGIVAVSGNPTTGPLEVTVQPHVKGFGQTPAGGVIAPWNMSVQAWPMDLQTFRFDYMPVAAMTSTSSLPPSEDRIASPARTISISAEDLAAIIQGKKRLYAYGTVLYVDVFRKARYTNFCWDFSDADIKVRNANECPIHNGSDWNNSLEPLHALEHVPMR